MADIKAAVQLQKLHRLQTQQDAEEGLQERFQHIGPSMDFRVHQCDMPVIEDSLMQFTTKKNSILGKIVPLSLVPISTSNALLFVASRLRFSMDKDADCYFPLPEYMATIGTISLALVVMGVVARHILDWVMSYRSRGEFRHATLIRCLEVMGKTMSLLQALALFSGIFVIAPQLSKVETNKPKEGEERSPYYCDHQLVMFAIVYVGMSFFFIVLAMFTFVYVKYNQCKDAMALGDVSKTIGGHPKSGPHHPGGKPPDEDEEETKMDKTTEHGSSREGSSLRHRGSMASAPKSDVPTWRQQPPPQQQEGEAAEDGSRRPQRPPDSMKRQSQGERRVPAAGRSFKTVKNFDRLPPYVKEKMAKWNRPGDTKGKSWNIHGPKYT